MTVSIMLSAASLVLCLFFFVYFRAYLRRRTGPEQLLEKFQEEVYKLIAEIDAATDKDALLVEERIKTLRAILEDVDKRINLHIREVDKRRFQEEAYAELGRKRNIAGSFPGVPQNIPSAHDLFSLSPKKPAEGYNTPSAKDTEAGENPAPDLPQEHGDTPQLKEPEPSGPRIVVAPQQITPKPLPLAEQVAELSKAGLSPRLIALRLGVSISEVELAIAISEGL